MSAPKRTQSDAAKSAAKLTKELLPTAQKLKQMLDSLSSGALPLDELVSNLAAKPDFKAHTVS